MSFLKPWPNGTPNSSQLEPSYKTTLCVGGWPNCIVKSNQLAGKPFNRLTTAAQSPGNETKQLGESWPRWANSGKLGSSWVKIWAWSTSSQLDPTPAKSSQVGGQPTPNSTQVDYLARVGLSWEYRLARALRVSVFVTRSASGFIPTERLGRERWWCLGPRLRRWVLRTKNSRWSFAGAGWISVGRESVCSIKTRRSNSENARQ